MTKPEGLTSDHKLVDKELKLLFRIGKDKKKISRLVAVIKKLNTYAQEKTFQDSIESINYISSTRIEQTIESVKDILENER